MTYINNQMTIKKQRYRTDGSRDATSRRKYDVLVLATMSAGKSSLINALIGHELLPSANEATTACLTSIKHCRTARSFRGACYSHTGDRIGIESDASMEDVRAWNGDSQVKRIRLFGKFRNRHSFAPRLVLHDTPGPNNSQDDRHGEMMLEAFRTVPFKLICYVLNAGQLGVRDDRKLLEQLRKRLDQGEAHQPIFILNKVDLLDAERGENLVDCVARTRHYLEEIGFSDPVILPTMTNLALYARKALHAEPLTRVERSKLRQSLEDPDLDDESALHAASMPRAIKARLIRDLRKAGRTRQVRPDGITADEAARLERLVVRSGIRTVEFLLNQRSTMA